MTLEPGQALSPYRPLDELLPYRLAADPEKLARLEPGPAAP